MEKREGDLGIPCYTRLPISIRVNAPIDHGAGFLQPSTNVVYMHAPHAQPEQQKRAYRKVDLRLLPILTIMYLASFLDRGVCYSIQSESYC